ncbi:MAG: ATP/GTP-binding protein [Candidatus Helarchaeota archaeon]
MNIVFLGSAGSGKTSLCEAYGNWLKTSQQASVGFVNLDPGTEFIPFSPDFDIRDYFTISKIMKDEKLGPNGAILRANELLLKQKDKIMQDISQITSNFVLIDTPGQLEAFIFQEAGPKFLQYLQRISPTISVFLIDAALAQSPSKLIVNLLLAIAVQIQLGLEMVYVLHKVDLIEKKPQIIKMIQDPAYFKNSILNQHLGSITEIALLVHQTLANLLPSMRIISTSIKITPPNFDEFHDLLNESFCACGDLT